MRTSQASGVSPMPRRAEDRYEPRPPVARRRVEELPELARLVVTTDEGGLERLEAIAAAAFGNDAEGTPGGHPTRLALERLLADRLERDGPRGGSLGRLAN